MPIQKINTNKFGAFVLLSQNEKTSFHEKFTRPNLFGWDLPRLGVRPWPRLVSALVALLHQVITIISGLMESNSFFPYFASVVHPPTRSHPGFPRRGSEHNTRTWHCHSVIVLPSSLADHPRLLVQFPHHILYISLRSFAPPHSYQPRSPDIHKPL